MVQSVIVMESDIPGDLTVAEYRALLVKPKGRSVRNTLRRLMQAVKRHD